MIVHTSRLFDQRADELGPLDVTRESGKEGLLWAPSWRILSPALKAFEAAQTAAEKNNVFVLYSIGYKAEMRESWTRNRAAWERVLRWEYPALDLEREHLTLQCYCVDHNYCHRTLLARDILPGACARLGIEYEFHGEL